MENKMTLFFNKITQKNDEKEKIHYFFIPIVEQIKEKDYENERSYRFAIKSKVSRKFYTSPQLLEESEKSRLAFGSLLSCYKVALTESEKKQLEATDKEGLFTGFLNFKPSEIESLIVFKNGLQLPYSLVQEKPAPSTLMNFA